MGKPCDRPTLLHAFSLAHIEYRRAQRCTIPNMMRREAACGLREPTVLSRTIGADLAKLPLLAASERAHRLLQLGGGRL